MQISAAELAKIIGGAVTGDPSVLVDAPAKIEEASPGQFTFLGNLKYEDYLYTTGASVVLIDESFKPKQEIKATCIRVPNVYIALSKLMDYFQQGLSYESKISTLASIDDSAVFGTDVSVGDFTIVKKGAVIGNGCVLHGQNFIGDNVVLGNHVILFPGVKIYHNCKIGNHTIIHSNAVIGSDGFGFAANQGDYNKISQIGNVVIGNHVEIGANTVIDRATMGSTSIRDGVKLDNLIQIGHNVVIGEHTVIAAQSGVAGSSKIGERSVIGGQVGIAGHVDIAPGVMIQAKSGINSTIKEANVKLYGYPAMEYQSYLKSYAYFKKLPEIVHKMREIEKELDKVKQSLES
jgi:UDP-3-O-[3-hydroxymyristoyl] glucosamine N-acyltransferase